jgi:hypothetical protein
MLDNVNANAGSWAVLLTAAGATASFGKVLATPSPVAVALVASGDQEEDAMEWLAAGQPQL